MLRVEVLDFTSLAKVVVRTLGALKSDSQDRSYAAAIASDASVRDD